MALNIVWIGFFAIALAAACVQALQGDLAVFGRLVAAMFDAARTGFDVALGLAGVMALWLGLLRVGERAGMVEALARAAAPLLRRLFPGVPTGHPAQGAMVMNVSANLLGLDNAATPLGLKAMAELQTLNPQPAAASDAQIMFIVLNTAGLTLVPTSVIAIRQGIAMRQGLAGFNAADIFLPTLLATLASVLAAVAAVAVVQRLPLWRWRVLLPAGLFAAAAAALVAGVARLPPARAAEVAGAAGSFCILAIVGTFIAAGVHRRIDVLDAFVEGAKEGFGVAVKIIAYLVAMLVAIGLFRAAGCMDYVMRALAAAVAALGLDTAFLPALPVGLMKILSGSGARALLVDVMQAHGVDSFAGRLAAIIQGSTETTFYVLAVYCGSVGVRDTRHALGCALFADAVGIAAAIGLAYLFFR
ncbi:nucleoside recognition domain-containing protein [Xylophilus sp.]|uniref:nucleoside recognition domain-containing protein n=1 Tax=Xylophilus sp. TaxID=2653893 RepID=UPI0013BC8FD5|nr:nucleoside recognition domain-containing protein [Xylophilus sp.]KAF1047794.1 MAG: Spore maturation protein A [Xylophilus sp.]